ncbi:LysM peptidoglycan-binding domain-containing protein [Mycobacterium sp. NAZ190054]|uniref:LysM peptidoglycan-binding domain-containing protein n=1 Tax=Mycobacterium sp. NAZ190054 TaxID=1747766 RepID=UPI0007932C39|nr:LysM peptidoglycan-binding domain-containing protein [Mycobacterium sp. NAZ190054]KWX61770.1 peptidoglycan-binding protein [Mycobacterium sp. NAZ190054]
MTILDDRAAWNQFERAPRLQVGGGRVRPVTPVRRSPSRRPGGAPVRHRGTGVLMSRAPHRRRPITPATTVLLALVAGAITLWLGLVGQFGGLVGGAPEIPGRLAVVQVQSGESLQQVAHRVAPGAPVADVVARIRELNKLESAALDAGQTLIAPVA